jgi:hypothetical protein
MEIKTIVEDGVHVFAVLGRANVRRRYRMQRETGTVTSFFPDKAGNRRWRTSTSGVWAGRDTAPIRAVVRSRPRLRAKPRSPAARCEMSRTCSGMPR